eukprot:1801540-Rhodomonas_salina.5
MFSEPTRGLVDARFMLTSVLPSAGMACYRRKGWQVVHAGIADSVTAWAFGQVSLAQWYAVRPRCIDNLRHATDVVAVSQNEEIMTPANRKTIEGIMEERKAEREKKFAVRPQSAWTLVHFSHG